MFPVPQMSRLIISGFRPFVCGPRATIPDTHEQHHHEICVFTVCAFTFAVTAAELPTMSQKDQRIEKLMQSAIHDDVCSCHFSAEKGAKFHRRGKLRTQTLIAAVLFGALFCPIPVYGRRKIPE